MTRFTLDVLTSAAQRTALLDYARGVAQELPEDDGPVWWDLFHTSFLHLRDLPQLLLAIRCAQRFVWERLHQGIWHQVSPWWRAAYHCTNITTAAALYESSTESSTTRGKVALFELDLALIMGGPFHTINVNDMIATLVQDVQHHRPTRASLLAAAVVTVQPPAVRATKRQRVVGGSGAARSASATPLLLPPVRPASLAALPALQHELTRGDLVVSSVKRLNQPSMSVFKREMFDARCPHVIEGVVSQWPAYRLWDLDYLLKVAGPRTVPIEQGQNYMSKDWTQKLMTLDAFVGTYVRVVRVARAEEGERDGSQLSPPPPPIAYLAQHQLFDQIAELSRDIVEPDYCIFSEVVSEVDERSDESALPKVQRNSWFGPSCTVSPLHYDKYHNLFCQVFGSKTIVLIDPIHSPCLYPNEGIQCNTSRVDLECEGWVERWPKMKRVPCQVVTVRPGEMLYIPPRWWHFCVAEEVSFSVSYWWCGGE